MWCPSARSPSSWSTDVTEPPLGADPHLEVDPPKTWAAGMPGVITSLRYSYQQMGGRRALLTLRKVNQKHGFDCPGCAWPDGEKRKVVEFCENGAKAVAE